MFRTSRYTPWRCWYLAGFAVWSIAGKVSAQRSTFDILKGGEVIGSIAASCTRTGDRTLYVMTSYSMMDLLWQRVVSTVMTAEYFGDALRSCRSYVHVNGAVRDSSDMTVEGDAHRCFIHPRTSFVRPQPRPWTTARMYFEEPIGQEHIFVESVLSDCALRSTGNGNYVLTLPNGNENRYIYSHGELQRIQVDRTFLDLTFQRRPE